VVDPKAPGFAQRAAFLLNRDGYCIVKDVLDHERLAHIRRGAEIAIREMVGRDPERAGNRGSHRYSFGNAPSYFGLEDYWAALKDPPAVVEIMEQIFGTRDFVCREGGGDFNTPGSVEYQHLHSDGGGTSGLYPDVKLEYRNDGNRYKVDLDANENPEYRYQVVNVRDLPARERHVTANYPMEICKDSDVGHTAYNGATRQIPATQALDSRNGNPIPTEQEEPLWMKMNVTQPCTAGSVMLRDNRAWHGGTPNLSQFTRAIPVALYELPPETPTRTHSLPYESWEKMTPMGKHICRYLVCDPGEEPVRRDWKPDWHNTAQKQDSNPNTAHIGAKVDNPFATAGSSASAKL
jgi:hypothetical protein